MSGYLETARNQGGPLCHALLIQRQMLSMQNDGLHSLQ